VLGERVEGIDMMHVDWEEDKEEEKRERERKEKGHDMAIVYESKHLP
jgi:hypothetical protein